MGSGVPIWVKSNTVGPVAIILVSGLPQQDDHTVGVLVLYPSGSVNILT